MKRHDHKTEMKILVNKNGKAFMAPVCMTNSHKSDLWTMSLNC